MKTKMLLHAILPLAAAAADVRHPNFIVILGEGSGWSSTSVQMDDRDLASKSGTVKTPNLERLARAGMRFSNGYAASPRCTPSRAALFTGRTPAALHMTFIGDGKRNAEATSKLQSPQALMELPDVETTIAELLKTAGYASAHFGKWHVGRESPSMHGFEENDGPNGNGGPEEVANPNPKQAFAMTAKGIDFMERQVKASRPFYLQMSHYPSQNEKGGGGKPRSPEQNQAEMGVVDETVGRILDAVARLDIAGNTYILYTTDHGTPGRNPPLTGGKGTVSEGGLRVPFIIRGPGVKAGCCSHVFVSSMDVLPTFAGLAGVKDGLPETLEGGSFAPVLAHEGAGTVKRPREEFVVHFPHYDKDPRGPASAIMLGDFKLIHLYETGEKPLFDLSKDPGERNNLADRMPDRAADLDKRLNAYLVSVKAQMPVPNPHYDPAHPGDPAPRGKRGGRNKNEP